MAYREDGEQNIDTFRIQGWGRSLACAVEVGPYVGVGRSSSSQAEYAIPFERDRKDYAMRSRPSNGCGRNRTSRKFRGRSFLDHDGGRVGRRLREEGRILVGREDDRPGSEVSTSGENRFPTLEECVGNTPLVRLQRLGGSSTNQILLKLEGNNPAGSVKDRAAISLITEAERRGQIRPGDTLIEATSGNTGIALAMAAAIKGYKMKLIMPSNLSQERKASMCAYGAELVDAPPGKMEIARDMAKEMEANGEGIVLDQFGNMDNPLAHYRTTGPELYRQSRGTITHLVSSMGTTGTIMGTSRYLKEMNPDIQIIGLQPLECASIPGIRRWPKEYLPSIYDSSRVDQVIDVSQEEAEEVTRALSRVEGIHCGVSSGGAVAGALRLAAVVDHAVICVIVCDRGDRYLSTGVFSQEEASKPPAITTTEHFWSSARALAGRPNPHILFTSGDDESGEPWCPDCRRAVHIVKSIAKSTGVTLLEVKVGDRSFWKEMHGHHPIKRHPRLGITSIPSLMKWDNFDPGEILELEQYRNAEEIEKRTLEFFGEHS